MRKVAAACLPLLALVLLAGSSQARSASPNDGCLVVNAGRGIVSINAKGFLLGRFESGTVDIEDPLQGDGSIRISGYEKKRQLTETKTRYIGSFVRFRASGLFKVRVEAVEMELSLAGKGTATLTSDGFFDAGEYSTDGQSFCESRFQPMPDVPRKLVIAGQTTG